MAEKRLIIAIDGPAGAGKTTIAQLLARQLGYLYINTGAMYRAIAWKALHEGIALDDAVRLSQLAAASRIDLINENGTRTLIDGHDVTEEIVTPRVSQAASIVSTIQAVRRALVARQQDMGRSGGVVMEGRDIGTKVFPQAEVKIYLDASAAARSKRRYRQDVVHDARWSLAKTQTEIEERDRRDSTRLDSPLVRAEDAYYLDSSELTVNEVVQRALQLIEARCRESQQS